MASIRRRILASKRTNQDGVDRNTTNYINSNKSGSFNLGVVAKSNTKVEICMTVNNGTYGMMFGARPSAAVDVFVAYYNHSTLLFLNLMSAAKA